MQRHTAQRKKRKRCRTLRSSSPKATRRRTSWQKKEQCWTNAGRRVHGGSESKDNAAGARRDVCSLAVCSELSVKWKNGRTVKSAEAEAERKVDFRGPEKKRRRNEANKYRCMRCGMRQQVHEDDRKMYRAEVPMRKCGKMGTASPCRS